MRVYGAHFFTSYNARIRRTYVCAMDKLLLYLRMMRAAGEFNIKGYCKLTVDVWYILHMITLDILVIIVYNIDIM